MRETNKAQLKRIFENNISLLSCAELAEKLGMTEKAIRRRVERNEIPVVKVGRAVRFDVDEVLKWLSKGAKNVS